MHGIFICFAGLRGRGRSAASRDSHRSGRGSARLRLADTCARICKDTRDGAHARIGRLMDAVAGKRVRELNIRNTGRRQRLACCRPSFVILADPRDAREYQMEYERKSREYQAEYERKSCESTRVRTYNSRATSSSIGVRFHVSLSSRNKQFREREN